MAPRRDHVGAQKRAVYEVFASLAFLRKESQSCLSSISWATHPSICDITVSKARPPVGVNFRVTIRHCDPISKCRRHLMFTQISNKLESIRDEPWESPKSASAVQFSGKKRESGDDVKALRVAGRSSILFCMEASIAIKDGHIGCYLCDCPTME